MGRARNGCAFLEFANNEVNLRDSTYVEGSQINDPASGKLKKLLKESALQRSAMFIEPGAVQTHSVGVLCGARK